MATKQKRPKRYKELLTTDLHKRFGNASFLSIVACYVTSCVLGHGSIVWRLIYGVTIVRTLLIFISSLLVFLIRVADQPVGTATASSPFQSFRRAIFTPNPYNVIFSYFLSAFFFGETCTWSATVEDKIYIVTYRSPRERPQLNERSIFYRSLFLVLAAIQVVHHLSTNTNLIKMPLHKVRANATVSIMQTLRSKALVHLAIYALAKTVIATVIGTIAYFQLYRQLLWDWWYSVLRHVFFFPRYGMPKGSGPSGLLELDLRFIFTGFLLAFIWEFSNYVYDVCSVRPPLRKDKPITDSSNDPNGSLLAGLRSKKAFAQNMAFWELVLICSKFGDRRKSFYQELERNGGSTWTQLLDICTKEFQGIQERIAATENAKAPAPEIPAPKESQNSSTELVKRPVSNVDMRSPSPRPGSFRGIAQEKVNDFVKAQGSQPGAASPPMKLLELGAQNVLSNEQRAALRPDAIKQRVGGLTRTLLFTAAASPFRQTFAKRLTGVVCGVPNSRSSIIVDAVDAIAELATHSLSEDQPGQVQKGIPALARTLADTIVAIQKLVMTMEPHWTDVGFKESDRKPSEEVLAVLDALKGGLSAIMGAFGEYLSAMGVSAEDATKWKKLLAPPKPVRPRTPVMRTTR